MAICNTLFNPSCNSNPDAITYTQNVIQKIVSWLIVVGVLMFVYEFIMGGYHFISSQGDAKKLEEARQRITNAILGLALIFVVFAILKLLGMVFGIQNLENLTISLPTL